MDDFNLSILSEAKNEYCGRLVNILSPLVLEGIQSILKEAVDLCKNNDEESKYLMTFQNFLSRVPKWNNDIIKEETKRIVEKSRCNYLEDLLTCVHISQLKVLTSIRVGTKQKKIDLMIPKLDDFIHKIYINLARKLYSNVYLFEMDILPLQYQKNMREAEIISKECIIHVIRDSIPIENILRSYLDETVEEEVIEETVTVEDISNTQIAQETSKEPSKETKDGTIQVTKDGYQNKAEKKPEIKVEPDVKANIKVETSVEKEVESISKLDSQHDKEGEETKKPVSKLSFSNTDLQYDQKTMKPEEVLAPKTLERLEKISVESTKRRKEEEEEEETIKIDTSGPNLKLDIADIQDLNKDSIKQNILNNVEAL